MRKPGSGGVKFLIEPAHGAGLTTLLVFLSVTNPFAFHIALEHTRGAARVPFVPADTRTESPS